MQTLKPSPHHAVAVANALSPGRTWPDPGRTDDAARAGSHELHQLKAFLWDRCLDDQVGRLPQDPERIRVKVALTARILQTLEHRHLSQSAAARKLGVTQPRVSDLYHGRLAQVSERRLMDHLLRLGYDIELQVRPSADPTAGAIVV
ncbi:MAG: XRE family transcriptional regulator [Burkholderiales bacterium]|nr:XRE family transcriptional regulator [Burkholderiales bacterium]